MMMNSRNSQVNYQNVVRSSMIRTGYALTVTLALLTASSLADVIVSYTVSSTQLGDSELPYATVLGGVSATSITGSGGLLPFGLEGGSGGLAFGGFVQGSLFTGFDPSGWPLLDFDTEALELTVTPPAGFQFRFSSIDWTFGAVSSTMGIEIKSSLNNFGSPVDGPYTINANAAGTGPTSLTAFPLIAGPVTFRWYAYSEGDFSDSNPYGGFVDTSGVAVRFNGTLVPLPKVTLMQRVFPSGQIEIQGAGAPNVTYNVQETSSLLTMPQAVTTTSAGLSGSFQYIEIPPNGTTQRFYRFQQQ
jgi:hypothetical protein